MRWMIVTLLLIGGWLLESTTSVGEGIRPSLLWLACACAAWRGLTPLTLATAIVAGILIDGISSQPFGTGVLLTVIVTASLSLLTEKFRWRSVTVYFVLCVCLIVIARTGVIACGAWRSSVADSSVWQRLTVDVDWHRALLATLVQAIATAMLALVFYPFFNRARAVA